MKKKILNFLFMLLFLAMIFSIPALFFLQPKQKFSEMEKRYLASPPAFSLRGVAGGSFMEELSDYISDHFPYRNIFVGINAYYDLLSGRQGTKDYFPGRDGRLFAQPVKMDAAVLDRNIGIVNSFSDALSACGEDIPLTIMLVPSSGSVLLGDNRYRDAEIVDYVYRNVRAQTVDLSADFQAFSAPETLYYRTDHHWTTDAALRAFLALSGKWELGAKEKHFTVAAVSDRFSGTLAASYGDRKLRDVLKVCVPNKSEGTYAVHYESQNKTAPSVFDRTKLDQKNQYEVFLGGNFDKIVIQTLSQTEDTLLLFKDSYANCLIPMLTPYFSKIVIIDPRYFSDSLQNITDDNDFTHILFVYNLNTFLADKSLAGVLAS